MGAMMGLVLYGFSGTTEICFLGHRDDGNAISKEVVLLGHVYGHKFPPPSESPSLDCVVLAGYFLLVKIVERTKKSSKSVGTNTDGDVDNGEGHSMDELQEVKKALRENEALTWAQLKAQALEINTCKGVGLSHGKILQILWEDYALRKKAEQCVVLARTTDGAVKPISRKGAKGVTSSILEPGNLDELLNPEVVSGRGKSRSKTIVRKRKLSEKQPLKRKLEFPKDQEEYEDYVMSPPLERSPFFLRLEKSAYGTVDDLPEFMKMTFRPPPGMQLSAVEMAMVAYIFGEGLDAREVLFPAERVQGGRDAFLNLRPGQDVFDDQVALNPLNQCNETLSFIRSRFMGYADDIMKIYVPIHKDNHWYLLVVDHKHNDVTYLDSCKCMNERAGRVDALNFMAYKIHIMLKDPELYREDSSVPPNVKDYHFREPLLSQQRDKSRDCRVYVTQWMYMSNLWSNYDLLKVDEHTRMRIAIDLVLSKANPMQEEILNRATTHWDKCERAFSKESSRKGPKSKQKVGVKLSGQRDNGSKQEGVAETTSVASSGSQSQTI
ncbi:hypothetical protein PIB30_053877 [Stylosanthes scabra]|uniref:Ubiquitin-like protease family profile domain-containing protein n=1 Tax=Stylosanthes scabra TaxID=79078 RepID=A0ABU6SIG0_9FABA|nr:hypothetical protein [Stylosanthes scabra]